MWNVNNVTNMVQIFNSCYSFDSDIKNFNNIVITDSDKYILNLVERINNTDEYQKRENINYQQFIVSKYYKKHLCIETFKQLDKPNLLIKDIVNIINSYI